MELYWETHKLLNAAHFLHIRNFAKLHRNSIGGRWLWELTSLFDRKNAVNYNLSHEFIIYPFIHNKTIKYDSIYGLFIVSQFLWWKENDKISYTQYSYGCGNKMMVDQKVRGILSSNNVIIGVAQKKTSFLGFELF